MSRVAIACGAQLIRFAFAAALAAWMPAVLAQTEARTVRIVTVAPPGGTLDAIARMLAQKLAALTGETHVVENRPGGNGVISVVTVLQAPADGRAMLLTGSSLVITPLLQKAPYAPFEDLRPVAAVGLERYALIASTHLPVSSARDLDQAARARPGGLNCAAGPGVMGFSCEQLKQRLDGRVTSVPYPGIAPALQALVGGHVDMTFVPLASANGLVRAKQARLLAVSSGESGDAKVPTTQDLWPEIMSEGVIGVYVAAATPEERVRRIERDIATVMAQPETHAAIGSIGLDPITGSTSESFTATMRLQQAAFAKAIGTLAAPKR